MQNKNVKITKINKEIHKSNLTSIIFHVNFFTEIFFHTILLFKISIQQKQKQMFYGENPERSHRELTAMACPQTIKISVWRFRQVMQEKPHLVGTTTMAQKLSTKATLEQGGIIFLRKKATFGDAIHVKRGSILSTKQNNMSMKCTQDAANAKSVALTKR